MSRLSRNVLYNVAGQGTVLLLGFVGVHFVFSRLGADAFGVIYFNLVLVGVLTTALELGVLATTVREVSAFFDSEPDYVERLIRTASLFYWGLGAVLFGAVFVAAPFLAAHWINLRTLDSGTAVVMLRLLSVTVLIQLPRALYASLFQGRQRMELNNGIDVASSAVQQLGLIAVVAAGGSAYQAAGWIALSVVLSTIAYLLLAGRLVGWRALIPAYDQGVVRRNLRFTGHMGALSILSMLLLQSDRIVVSKLLPIAVVGYYSFASTVVVRISFAYNAIAQAALPSFARLHSRGDAGPLLVQYRKLQDLVCFGLVPVFAALVFGALPLYTNLFNARVAGQLLLPTALLSLGFYMGATVAIPYQFAIAAGRPDIPARANLYALFVVVPWAVTATYLYGITGAATSWIAYGSFLYLYMVPRTCRECLHIPPLSWHAHVARAFGLAAATYGAAWLLLSVTRSFGLGALILADLAANLAFGVGALLLIGPDLRQTVRRLPATLTARG